jgi:glycerophosphoryl diester phosphodiesterase
MRFLIVKSPEHVGRKTLAHPSLVCGQLLTPLTRYANHGGAFAIDNGAFSGFNADAFRRLLGREEANRSRCIFVAIPDVVSSAKRTAELWKQRHRFAQHWPMALVAQNGLEDMEIPWFEMNAVFIGGDSRWKDSQAAIDIVKTAKALGVHVHVGRVNTIRRFQTFHEAGADTCDGTGVSMYDHMLDDIARGLVKERESMLFDTELLAKE